MFLRVAIVDECLTDEGARPRVGGSREKLNIEQVDPDILSNKSREAEIHLL